MWAYAYPSHSFSLQIRNRYIQLDLQATYWWHKVIMPTYSGKSHQERPQDLVRGVNSPLAAWGEIFFWKFDYEMVHSEVYVNKYVISIAPFSPPPVRNSPIQKTALFACFRFLIFHPFLQGVSWPICPMCGRPWIPYSRRDPVIPAGSRDYKFRHTPSRSIVMCICLCLCLCVCLSTSMTAELCIRSSLKYRSFFARVIDGRRSVLLWRRCECDKYVTYLSFCKWRQLCTQWQEICNAKWS